MRIISGSARGKKLAEFSGSSIRPTADRVREALFSMLFSRCGDFTDSKVLDLFAGSGALALEALSRGAASAVLVEAAPSSLKVIRANIGACRMTDRATLVPGTLPGILKTVTGRGPFDLIFIDPPYGKGLVPPVLAEIEHLGLLSPGGSIVVETEAREALPAASGTLNQTERRTYGSTAITFYERIDPSA